VYEYEYDYVFVHVHEYVLEYVHSYTYIVVLGNIPVIPVYRGMKSIPCSNIRAHYTLVLKWHLQTILLSSELLCRLDKSIIDLI